MPTTDERRALLILHNKEPNDETLVSRFIDYLRNSHKDSGLKPEQIAEDFQTWQERNQT